MVLEKTLESPLDCEEIQPVQSEGDQPWDFFGTLASNCVFVFVCTYYMEVDRGNESKARVEDVPDDLFLFAQDLADVYDIP